MHRSILPRLCSGFWLRWLTSQARFVRVYIPRRARHASCESPWHFSAKRHLLGACFSRMAPFRTRFSPCKMAYTAYVQRLIGRLYPLWYFYIPTCRFTAQTFFIETDTHQLAGVIVYCPVAPVLPDRHTVSPLEARVGVAPLPGGLLLVAVDERVAPLTSASKPCLQVSPHTAPQLLSPCHGYVASVP